MSEPEPEITEQQVAEAQTDEPAAPAEGDPAAVPDEGGTESPQKPGQPAPGPKPAPDKNGDTDERETAQGRQRAPSSEDHIEQATKKLGQAARAYSRKVLEVLGPELDGWATCELCANYFPGIRLPMEPNAETKAALRVILGMPSLENYRPARDAHVCEDCAGLGNVLSGSEVPQFATLQCSRCKGKGYLAPERLSEPEPAATGNGHAPVVTVPGDEAPPDFDPWGRPRGDPDYYRMPIPGATI